MQKQFVVTEVPIDDYPILIKAIRECNRSGRLMEIIYESPTKGNSMILHIKAKRDPVDYYFLGSKYGTWRTEPWYGPWRYLRYKYGSFGSGIGQWRSSRAALSAPQPVGQLSFPFE